MESAFCIQLDHNRTFRTDLLQTLTTIPTHGTPVNKHTIKRAVWRMLGTLQSQVRAFYAELCISRRRVVRPSVCVSSVCHTQARIRKSSPTNSPKIKDFRFDDIRFIPKIERVHPERGR